MDMNYASKGTAGAGLGLGIAGTALGLLNGGVGNLFGGWGNCSSGWNNGGGVSHYELTQESKISDLQAQVALRDANVYNDQKLLDMYKYIDGRFRDVENHIGHQSVVNAQITANLSCMQNAINTLSGLTKTVIPIANICPEPMARYNSWVAPTATADEATTP